MVKKMFLSTVRQEEGLGPKALVSQCAFQKVMKISVKRRSEQHPPPQVRSFGELSELEFKFKISIPLLSEI